MNQQTNQPKWLWEGADTQEDYYKGDNMTKSYREKFKLELTSKELEVIEEALEMSKSFKVYGDGREAHQKQVDKIR